MSLYLLNKPKALSYENIRQRVISRLREPIKTQEDLEVFLKAWWCRRYVKPYKCIEILEYTLEELLMEYLDVEYRANPERMKDLDEEEDTTESEDEAWLKEKMGSEYSDKKTQEKILSELDIKSDDQFTDKHLTFGE